MASETAIPWSDYLGLGAYAVNLSQQLLGVPSPLDLFIGSFSGRPTMDATAAIAATYNSYTSPVTKLLALGASDLLKQGIPISSPAAGPVFGPYYKAALVLENEIRWQSQAPNIVALDNATLGNALNEAGNPGSGTATLDAIDSAYRAYIARGNWPGMAAIATNPPDGTGKAGQLEQGAAKQFIAHNPTTTPGTGPSTGGPPLPPNPGPPDAEGDELIDSANAIEQYLYYIAYWLRPTGTITAQPDPCCEQIVASLNLIQTGLSQIASATASLKTPPIDLSAIAAALDCVCTQATAIATASVSGSDQITAAINGLRDAISGAGDQGAAAIVNEMQREFQAKDIAPNTIRALVNLGFMNSDDEANLQGIPPERAIAWIHSTRLWREIEKIGKEVGTEAKAAKDKIESVLPPGPSLHDRVLKAFGVPNATSVKGLVHDIIKALVTYLTPKGPVSLDSINVNPDDSLAHVLEIGGWGKLLEYDLELLTGGNVGHLSALVDWVMGVCGLEEIREVQLGPLIRNGIAAVAEMDAKKLFRQQIPGAGWGYGLAARGTISRQIADLLAAYNGLPKELEDPMANAAFHGMSPRIMLRLIEAHLFTPAEIQDELTYSGMRPVSQARLLRAADFIGTNTYRNQLNATIEQAYEAGLLDDGEVCSMVDSNDHNTDRCQLILERLHLKVRMDSAKALEAEYATLYQAGLIDATTYEANLSGLGLQQWKVSSLAAINEAKVAARLSREEAAAARALARATAAVERKAAIRNYLQGNIDFAALTAALIVTGLTPVQALAWADLAKLQQDGSLRWAYGLHLPREQAGLLSDQVKALASQYEKLEIDQPTFTAALQSLKIPATYINAILADASTKEGSKVKGSYIPVQLA